MTSVLKKSQVKVRLVSHLTSSQDRFLLLCNAACKKSFPCPTEMENLSLSLRHKSSQAKSTTGQEQRQQHWFLFLVATLSRKHRHMLSFSFGLHFEFHVQTKLTTFMILLFQTYFLNLLSNTGFESLV